MAGDLNEADKELLKLVHEGREEEARRFLVEHVDDLSPDVREDVIAALSEEDLEPEILKKEEEELQKKRKSA
jgi:hypothetical protein